MSEHEKKAEVNPESRKRGWEITDAHIKPLAWMALGLAATTVATMIFCLYFMGVMDNEIESDREDLHPMARYADQPVSPLLQTRMTRSMDLEKYRAQQDAAANHYGWLSQKEDEEVIHLPVDRAAELMLSEHKFPHRPDTQQ